MSFQTTLGGAVVCAGVGLHTGLRIRMTLHPAPADEGVVFRRVDLPDPDGEGADEIRLAADAVVDTRFGTTIANRCGARVQTVEHLLAAVAGMGLDNVRIDLDAPEPPAMDGSALPFAKLIARAGLDELAAPRRVLRVIKPIEVELEGRRARFTLAPRSEIEVAIAFDDPLIGRQRNVFVVDPAKFLSDIAPARTFAFLPEVAGLRAQGLARGGSMDNCVVLDDGAVLNEDGLRFADEFVRHKVLDVLGDLTLAGWPIVGRYTADRPGHRLNNLALRALMDDPDAWVLDALSAPAPRRTRPAGRPGALRPAQA